MISYEKTRDMLDRAAQELPEALYEGLNGGILLLPETRLSPYARNEDLFIAGEYRASSDLGSQIVIFYGSVSRLWGRLPEDEYAEKLREVLKHELLHHLERRAGVRDLEIEDARQIRGYLAGEEGQAGAR